MDESSLSWAARIAQARQQGEFSIQDSDEAQCWATCRVGEITAQDPHGELLLDRVREAWNDLDTWRGAEIHADVNWRDTDGIIAESRREDAMGQLAVLGYAFGRAVSRDDFDAAQKFHDAIGNVL